MDTSGPGGVHHYPAWWTSPLLWTAVLLLLTVIGAGFLGPLSADPRVDLVLPDRIAPDVVVPSEPPPSPEPEPEPDTEPNPAVGHAVLAAILVLATVAIYLLARFLRSFRQPEHDDELDVDGPIDVVELPPANERLVREHLSRASAELYGPQDSADAVIRCWIQLEAATSHAGTARKPHETPSEYTADVLKRFDASPGDIDVLLKAYERVRFATSDDGREVRPADLDAVRAALERVTAAVGQSMPGVSPAGASPAGSSSGRAGNRP